MIYTISLYNLQVATLIQCLMCMNHENEEDEWQKKERGRIWRQSCIILLRLFPLPWLLNKMCSRYVSEKKKILPCLDLTY